MMENNIVVSEINGEDVNFYIFDFYLRFFTRSHYPKSAGTVLKSGKAMEEVQDLHVCDETYYEFHGGCSI